MYVSTMLQQQLYDASAVVSSSQMQRSRLQKHCRHELGYILHSRAGL